MDATPVDAPTAPAACLGAESRVPRLLDHARVIVVHRGAEPLSTFIGSRGLGGRS